MAHNLATINGRIAMAYAGETPWHRLGVRMGDRADVQTALAAAALDWTVDAQPLYLADGREVDRRAIVRDLDAAILGTVGPAYVPMQNADAFGILTDACAESGVTIEAAGALGNGERVWMLAKMPTTIEPVPGDQVNGYFLVCSSHNGSLAYSARLTPIRVVCQNTLSAAMARRGTPVLINIRHTANASTRLDEARRLVAAMTTSLQDAGETFATLASRKLTKRELVAYVEQLLPKPTRTTIVDDGTLSPGQKAAMTRWAKADASGELDRIDQRRATVVDLVAHGQGAELAKRTAWGAYNAVVEYVDHVWPYEEYTGAAPTSRRLEQAIFGPGFDLKAQALVKARELVAAA